VVPFGPDWAVITDVNIGVLFVLAVSSVGVLATILAGWSSNSKYALLGALRSSAQMVSYEVSMGLAIIGALMFARTLSLSGIVVAQQSDSIWFLLYQPIGFMIFLISGIAENNRAPFDLPEAESELVAGFHTEYSGFRWSLFFMAEYTAMVVVTAVATTLYLGGWYFPFVYRFTEAKGHHNAYVVVSLIVFLAKAGLLLYLYFWLRWTLPRFRYDQLMDLGWKWLLPAALVNIVVSAIAIVTLQGLNGSGVHTIKSMANGLHLTPAGKGIAIGFGVLNLFLTAGILSLINWRSRDFNLKKQRSRIRLVNLPKGKPAVAPVVDTAAQGS
jgi:NADH-quinone oxidoreductase subunit H